MPKLPKLTVLIVNYNSADDCIQLISSLKNQTFKDYSTIIIDNNSSKPDEFKKLKSIRQKNIILIQNSKNTGLTGAVNFALRKISTSYTLLLNPDITLEKNAIKELVKTIESDKNAFCVGGAIYDYSTKKIYSLGGKFNPLTGIAKPLRHFTQPRKLKQWEYVDACILLFKTGLFKKLRYDERFFMYVETEDIILRAMKQNLSSYSNPRAICYHKMYGSTGGKKSQFSAYYLARNKFLFLRKHLSQIEYFYFILATLALVSPLQIVSFIAKMQFNLIPAFVRGTLAGLKIQ